MGITLNMVPLSFRKMTWDFQGLWPLLQWDADFNHIYSFQQAFFKCQSCARNFLPWQNVMGKWVVKTKELLMRDPLNQSCWCPPQEVGPPQTPETWLEQDLIPHHHVGSERGPAVIVPASGCVWMAHCVQYSFHRTSSSPAQGSLTELPKRTAVKSRPQLTTSPPTPDRASPWSLHTLKSYWDYTVNKE